MSELQAYQAATAVLGLTAAVTTTLWVIARGRANSGRQLVLLVIGRATQALRKRGVPGPKVIELIAPELKEALERRARTK